MADDSTDDSQKTEEPTQKRLQDALKKGQTINSREVTNFFMLAVLAFNIAVIFPMVMKMTVVDFKSLITRPHDYPVDANNLTSIAGDIFLDAAGIFAILVFATVIAALAGNLMQGKKSISLDPIKPKLEKISPLKGLKKMFSMKSIVEFAKGILKMVLIGSIAVYVALPFMGYLKQLPGYDIHDTLLFLSHVAMRMMIGVCIAMAFIALGDYLYQRFEYYKNLRMSFKDIKDEHKQQEGDPHVKAKIRQVRMERAQQRMMSNVPDADVVVTNPTHFAVALKYDGSTMSAPSLVAKGADNIAFKIREVAEENDVPIVENPPIARALYDNVELDREIPVEHYQAVAEIISYVYKLKGKR